MRTWARLFTVLRRLLAVAGLVLAVALVTGLLALKTERGRGAVLRSGLGMVEAATGLRARADRLEVSLASREAVVRGLVLDRPDEPPLVSAAEVQVVWAKALLFGDTRLDRLAVRGLRITLVRRGDGRFNLPAGGAGRGGGPPPLPRTLSVEDASLTVVDDANGVRVEAQELSLTATTAETPASGRLRAGQPVRWQSGERQGEIVLDDVPFHLDEALTIEALSLRAAEGRLAAKGRWEMRDGKLGFDVNGALDLARLLGEEGGVHGELAFTGRVAGTAAEPEARVDVRGPDLGTSRGPLVVSARAQASPSRVVVEHAKAAFLEGTFEGKGVLALDAGGKSHAEGRWSGVDLAAALGPANDRGLAWPRATVEGELKAAWPGLRVGDAEATLAVRATPPETSPGSPSGLPLAGEGRVALRNGRWTLEIDAGAGPSSRLAARLGGQLDAKVPRNTTVEGRLEADVGRLESVLPPNLRGLGLAGPLRASLDLTGSVGEPRGAVVIHGQRLSIAGVPSLGLEGQGLVDRDGVTVQDLTVRTGDAEARASGSLRFASGALEGTYRFSLPDLRVVKDALPESVLPVGAVQGKGTLAGTLARPQLTLEANASRVTVAGQPATNARLEGSLDGTAWRARVLELTRDGEKLRIAGAYDPVAATLEVEAEARAFSIRPLPAGLVTAGTFPFEARLDVDFRGEGPLRAPRGSGRLALADAAWDGRRVGPLEGHLTFTENGLGLEARASDLRTRLDGNVRLAAPHDFRIEGRLDEADVSAFARLFGQEQVALRGHSTLAVEAKGRLGDPASTLVSSRLQSFEGEIRGRALRIEQPGEVRLGSDRLSVEGLRLAVGESRLTVNGSVGAAAEATSVEATLSGRLEDLRALWTDSDASWAGTVQAKATLSGTRARPSLSATLALENGVWPSPGLPPVEAIGADVSVRDGRLDLKRFTARWSGAEVKAEGEVTAPFLARYLPKAYLDALPRVPTLARLELDAEGSAQEVLAPFVDPPGGASERRATLSIRLRAASASLTALTGEARLEGFDAQVGEVPLTQSGPALLKVGGGVAVLEPVLWEGAGTRLEVSGRLKAGPVEAPFAGATIQGKVDGQADLRLAQSLGRGLETGGRANLTIEVTGPLSATATKGEVRLEEAMLRYRPAHVALDGFSGRVRWSDETLEAEELRGSLNGGSASFSGRLRRQGKGAWQGSLNGRVRNAFLEWPKGFHAGLRADLALEPANGTMVLKGTATLTDGVYRTRDYFSLQVLDVVNRFATAPPQPSRFDPLELDVAVKSREDVLLQAVDGRMGVSVDLRLAGTLGKPDLEGRLGADEGQLFFSGRRYEIDAAELDFTRGAGFEPYVQARGMTLVSNYAITADFSGPATRLRTRFNSDPPLGERDIVSLLTAGRTIGDTAAGGGQTDALAMASGGLLGRGGGALGFDSVRIERSGETQDLDFDPTAVNPSASPTSRLTFSKRLTNQLSATFSQDLTQAGALTWFVAWKPRPPFEVRVAQDDDRRASLEFRHDVSFGVSTTKAAAPRARRRRARETRVDTVRLSGETGADLPALQKELKLGVGDRFSYEDWLADRDRLEAWFGRAGYAEARIYARREVTSGGREAGAGETSTRRGESAATGASAEAPTPRATSEPRRVALDYVVTRGPRTSLDVRGAPDAAALRDRIARSWSTAAYERSIEDEAKALARAHLLERSHPDPRITTRFRVSAKGDEKTLLVEVEPGPSAQFLRVSFTGNAEVETADLEALVADKRRLHAAWLETGALVSSVLDLYRARGRLGAKVSVRPPVLGRDEATLPVVIEEGPAFVLRGVEVKGAVAPRDEDVKKAAAAAGLVVGEPYTPGAVIKARGEIETAYRRAGYGSATVSLEGNVDPKAASVRVVADVEEGEKHVLKEVVVEGAPGRELEKAKASLKLAPGSPVDLEAWADARQRVYETGLFKGVDIEQEATSAPAEDGEAREVGARVRLESWPAVRLRYGLQLITEKPVSSDANGNGLQLGAVAELTRRNLFGRAASTGLSVQARKDEQQARAFLSLPRTFSLPVRSSLYLSSTKDAYDDEELGGQVDSRVTELTLEERARVTRRIDLAGSYNLKWTQAEFPVPLPGVTGTGTERVDTRLASLVGTALFDARNDLIDTTKGAFSSVSYEWGDKQIGSEYPLRRLVGQQFFYVPVVRGLVVGAAGRAEYATGQGTYFVERDRLKAGGANTVRGYSEDELASRALINLLGGSTTLLVLNAELRFNIVGPIRGVAFGDGAILYADLFEQHTREKIWSTGIGLRYVTPLGILRLDYGIPLDEGFKPSRGRVYFSLGQIF